MVWWFCFQRYLLCVILIVQFLTLLLWICILLYGEPACSPLYLKAVFNLTAFVVYFSVATNRCVRPYI